jgi:hypothetical protein
MKKQPRGTAFVLILALFISASCTGKQKSAPPKAPPDTTPKTEFNTTLTAEKAIALANAEATKQGRDLDEYDPPKAQYDSAVKGKDWTVFYEGKTKAPGNHFLVWVNDETKECKLMPGE